MLTQRLIEGTLDLAVMYRPTQPPGLTIEHLFDEEFVLVTSVPPTQRRSSADYVFIDWGPDFQQDHSAAYPEFTNPGLNLDLGSAGIDYLLGNECSGYFPHRLVRTHIARGRLRQPSRARKFVYPVYMVYPEARNEEAYEPFLSSLKRQAAKFAPIMRHAVGAHLEPGESADALPDRLDARDRGGRQGPAGTAASISSMAASRTLEHRLDRAIAAVAHPAIEPQ